MGLSEFPTAFGSQFVSRYPSTALMDALETSSRVLARRPPGKPPSPERLNFAAERGLAQLIPDHHGGGIFRRKAMMQGMRNEQVERLMQEGPRLFEAPAWELLDMNIENGSVKITSKVMSMDDVFMICFPEQDEAWRNAVQRNTDLILGAIARTHQIVQISDDRVWIPIADLTGSMARSFFRPAPSTNRESMQVLWKLYESQRQKLSPALKNALKHSHTGIFDMDIKFDPLISLDTIIKNLEYGSQIDIHKVGIRQNICMPDGTPGCVQIIQLEKKKVCKITIEPSGGVAFSIDIAPRSTDAEEIHADYRAGPHQSTKKTHVHLSLMALKSADGKTIETGVSGDPFNTIDGMASSWGPTLIEKPVYQDLTQGIHALLSAIRVELTTPSGSMFDDRIAQLDRIFDGLATHSLSMSRQWESEPDSNRIAEIIREGMVCMCSDKDFLIRALRKTGLDVFLRMVEQLKVIEDMSQEEFNRAIVNNPELANMCASLFDFTRKTPTNRPLVLTYPDKRAKDEASKYTAAQRFVASHHRGPRSKPLTDESLFEHPNYMVWQLEPRSMQNNPGVLTAKQYWGYSTQLFKKYTELQAYLLLNNKGTSSLTGIAMGPPSQLEQDVPYDQIEWLTKIYWSQVSQWALDTRDSLFGQRIARADLIHLYHGRECGDPFYTERIAPSESQEVVGFPPGKISMHINQMTRMQAMTITCPLTVSSRIALHAAREQIRTLLGVKRLGSAPPRFDVVTEIVHKSK